MPDQSQPIGDMAAIPSEITQIVKRLHADAMIPAYVEFPRGKDRLFIHYHEATVAQLEQAVELQTRAARQSIQRFMFRGGSPTTAKTAAGHIERARVFRARSLELRDQPITEAAMPFPLASP